MAVKIDCSTEIEYESPYSKLLEAVEGISKENGGIVEGFSMQRKDKRTGSSAPEYSEGIKYPMQKESSRNETSAIQMMDKRTCSIPEDAESIECHNQAKASRNASSSIQSKRREIDCALKIIDRRNDSESWKEMNNTLFLVVVIVLYFVLIFKIITLKNVQCESVSKETNLTLGNLSSVLVIDGIQNGEWSNETKLYVTADMFGTIQMEEKTSVTLQLGSTSLNKTVTLYLADKTEDLHLQEAVQEIISRNSNSTVYNETRKEEIITNRFKPK
ncbi:hypothetical protein NPIL_50021 [Nephila pilipes]|uniref:Uncharacterized protein n=1 Tax=Nephila pilipes TaxID=299642 RepID=A0A8X6NKK0_NEPPI|nr:hypothetical protein NPIL_50021 [Nephila pilipes]